MSYYELNGADLDRWITQTPEDYYGNSTGGYDADEPDEDQDLEDLGYEQEYEDEYPPRADLVAEADFLITSLLLECRDGTTARDVRITRILARAKARLTRRDLADLPF